MILEAAILNVRPGEQGAFEQAMADARPLIAASSGFRGMEVRPCLEDGCRYLLLVWWERLEDHTDGFRGSDRYAEWKRRLHHFYQPFPVVEHFAAPLFAEPDPLQPVTSA
ncbi:antibiotic biosynthesis monooxygenase [Azospirillum sp. TSH100]|uniref:antibiotic biosynthesis monooxygenase family protein n=1 Tax=Azospirillum sp. TSH100 TaxID=652764 RepID=UPI000D61A001|nr:antibiotic biosynthesis monooxygenase [Azospirillum sp. TSH100]PWC89190.1 antibiotic biosynthesis monooxygenase [Azospirillum sp. TSH100]QCG87011.1 antibiotic biosynthesis monooxygenase [Azospirillum sp. TSH100]